MRVPDATGRAVAHAEVTVGQGLVMLAEPPGGESGSYPPSVGPSPVGIMVQLDSPADVERLHDQAISAGGAS